jgi:hypothetical protein
VPPNITGAALCVSLTGCILKKLRSSCPAALDVNWSALRLRDLAGLLLPSELLSRCTCIANISREQREYTDSIVLVCGNRN